MRYQLRIDVCLAYAAGDELCVLGSEINYEHRAFCHWLSPLILGSRIGLPHVADTSYMTHIWRDAHGMVRCGRTYIRYACSMRENSTSDYGRVRRHLRLCDVWGGEAARKPGVDDEEDTTLLMDGRFGGVEYTRWLMYGTLSQILRV